MRFGKLIGLPVAACFLCLAHVLFGQDSRTQQQQLGPMGRVLPTSNRVRATMLEKSRHIPTDPDELAPTARKQKRFDAAQARQESQDLVKLSQGVAGQIDGVSKGVIPAGLIRQLKQIEKLSKRLRAQLSP
jgi:hypothetical protein